MSTVTDFTPSINSVFQFQANLTGANPINVSSTSTTFIVSVIWNVYRGGGGYPGWYILIADEGGSQVLCTPLIGSPPGYPISLTAGYFTSTLVFLEATNQFVVTP
jgi:hypothetical protein